MSQFHDVSSPYGAPMGRRSQELCPTGKVRLFRVRLNNGGYDDGGAYWGCGQALWCAEDVEEGNWTFVRAPSRAAAAHTLKIANRLLRPLPTESEG